MCSLFVQLVLVIDDKARPRNCEVRHKALKNGNELFDIGTVSEKLELLIP